MRLKCQSSLTQYSAFSPSPDSLLPFLSPALTNWWWREHAQALSHVWLCSQIDGQQPARLLFNGGSPGKNTGTGCHALLRGVCLTRGWNPPLLGLLHWQAGSSPPSATWEATDDKKKKWLRKSSGYSLPTDIYQPLASEFHIPPHPSDARTIGRYRFDPWVGKIPWRKHGNATQYSCLDNSGDRRIWWATVHGVAKSQIQLKRLSRHTQASFLSTHPKKQSHFNHRNLVTPKSLQSQISLLNFQPVSWNK